METFPYWLLSRRYAAGYPQWTPQESGVAAMRIGTGLLRTRDEFGQGIWAVHCMIEVLTQSEAEILWGFIESHRSAEFYWSDAKVGPLGVTLYKTYVARFDPDNWPRIVPNASVRDHYDATIPILPALPTVAVATLAAWWTMDEGTSVLEVGTEQALTVGTDEVLTLGENTEVTDESGNGHTGTSSQSTDIMGVDGKVNGSLDFNGTTDYVAVADASDLRLTDGGCIAAWIYPDSLGESNEGRIVDKSAAVDAGAGYAFALAASNKLAFRVAGDGEWTLSTASAIALAAWQHVAVSFGGSGRRLYVNGVDVTSTGGSLTQLPPSSTAAIRIGNRAGATDRSFNGKIDDVRIYQRPLCLQEIQAIYAGGSGTAEEVVP